MITTTQPQHGRRTKTTARPLHSCSWGTLLLVSCYVLLCIVVGGAVAQVTGKKENSRNEQQQEPNVHDVFFNTLSKRQHGELGDDSNSREQGVDCSPDALAAHYNLTQREESAKNRMKRGSSTPPAMENDDPHRWHILPNSCGWSDVARSSGDFTHAKERQGEKREQHSTTNGHTDDGKRLDLLKELKGKHLLFVGDSTVRNSALALLAMLCNPDGMFGCSEQLRWPFVDETSSGATSSSFSRSDLDGLKCPPLSPSSSTEWRQNQCLSEATFTVRPLPGLTSQRHYKSRAERRMFWSQGLIPPMVTVQFKGVTISVLEGGCARHTDGLWHIFDFFLSNPARFGDIFPPQDDDVGSAAAAGSVGKKQHGVDLIVTSGGFHCTYQQYRSGSWYLSLAKRWPQLITELQIPLVWQQMTHCFKGNAGHFFQHGKRWKLNYRKLAACEYIDKHVVGIDKVFAREGAVILPSRVITKHATMMGTNRTAAGPSPLTAAATHAPAKSQQDSHDDEEQHLHTTAAAALNKNNNASSSSSPSTMPFVGTSCEFADPMHAGLSCLADILQLQLNVMVPLVRNDQEGRRLRQGILDHAAKRRKAMSTDGSVGARKQAPNNNASSNADDDNANHVQRKENSVDLSAPPNAKMKEHTHHHKKPKTAITVDDNNDGNLDGSLVLLLVATCMLWIGYCCLRRWRRATHVA